MQLNTTTEQTPEVLDDAKDPAAKRAGQLAIAQMDLST